MKTFAFLISLLCSSSLAGFTLHPLFTDHMVIQREHDVKIYGTGEAGEIVTVEFHGQKVSSPVKDGKWSVTLKAMKAGGPFELKVSSTKNTLTLIDILLGDVWVLGGQSNMQTDLNYYFTTQAGKYSNLFTDTLTYSNANIRMFKQAQTVSEERQSEPRMDANWGSNWKEVTPSNARYFSATGYYFGKAIQESIKVPVGLVFACVGGTPAEGWVPKEVLTGNPIYADILNSYQKALSNYPTAFSNFQVTLAKWNADKKAGVSNLPAAPRGPMGPAHNNRPNGLFNGMIAPLVDFEVKGAIWYQGENNARDYSNGILYRSLFSDLIKNWRTEWKNPEMPFYFCQLAAYKPSSTNVEDQAWSYLREAQEYTLKLKNTGMATLIDVGMEADIHPPYKQVAGSRLAELAKVKTYGVGKEACGPSFSKLKLEGAKATISFDNVGSGLMTKPVTLGMKYDLDNKEPLGFSVCDESTEFVWAKAELKGNEVVVTHPEGKKIMAVRYAWANFPLVNLYNKEGFPASPFRTDDLRPDRLPAEITKVTGTRPNLLQGCTFESSNNNPNGSYRGLVDGIFNLDNGQNTWSSDPGTSFPKEVTIQLKSTSELSTIIVFNSATGGTKDVEISVSADGKTFTSVGKNQFTNYSEEKWILALPKPQLAQFIKLTFLNVHDISFQNKANGYVFIREVMAFGK